MSSVATLDDLGISRDLSARSQAIASIPDDEFEGGDPVRYVVSLNLHRRHLSESQRQMVGARVATLQKGANQHSSIELSTFTQQEAAELLNVSTRNVATAAQPVGLQPRRAGAQARAADRGAGEGAQARHAEQRCRESRPAEFCGSGYTRRNPRHARHDGRHGPTRGQRTALTAACWP